MGRLLAASLLLLVTFGSRALGDNKVLFIPGQEYSYSYDVLVTTGTEAPVGYASAYKIHANLKVQAETSNRLNVKLDELSIGLYNGPWSYFPLPEFQASSTADLSSLAEPFQIQLDENGKFKILVMNDQEPEWASNMKRGIATYLQLDLSLANFDEVRLHRVPEATTMGECDTKYEIIPRSAGNSGYTTVSKFRNHADCSDVPTRVKSSSKAFYTCPDKQTKNVLNSTAYATYVVDDTAADKVTIHHITVFSSILYWPFTSSSPYLYTWLNLTIHLNNVGPISTPLPALEAPENHEDLSYVFEQNDFNDPEDDGIDLKLAEPIFFHQTAGESDSDVLHEIMEKLHKTISEVAESITTSNSLGDDLGKFHKNSPFAILPKIASLDLESLKHCYQRYLEAYTTGGEQASIEFQLFLDGLVLVGSGPSLLAIRDILTSTTDHKIIARLAASFPHYIYNPSEALGKELDPIFDLTKKASLGKTIRRILELSMATVISKSCAKTNCSGTGLLTKYISHFEGLLTNSDFEVQTVGVLGLRNLAVGNSLDKLLEIAKESKRDVPQSVRVQAIWSLRPLSYQGIDLFQELLPVFYNRSEGCEVRTSTFSFLISLRPDKRILHEIAYYMWSETCGHTANVVRSTLMNLANTKNPCGGESQPYAQTILQYLPPGVIDPTKSMTYASDYYDAEHGFGRMAVATVQKSGITALPITVYVGGTSFIGGYATGHVGIFIRLEGFGKTIGKKMADLRNANVEEIKTILSKVDVKTRPAAPLKLELAIMHHDRVILYYAADERTLNTLPRLLSRLHEIKSSLSLNVERSLTIAGAMYQQPMEIGVPISVSTALSAIGSVAANVTLGKGEGLLTKETDLRLQLSTFAVTRIANHFPGIGAAFGVSSARTMRVSGSTHVKLGIDLKNQGLHVTLKPPSESDPVIVITHATTSTSLTGDTVYSDGSSKESKAQDLLKESCPTCSAHAVVSRGAASRKTRERVIRGRFITGIKSTVKYFDCEKDYGKSSILRRFGHIFNPSSKNAGIFQSPLTKAVLSIQQLRDSLFLSPTMETCGVSWSVTQDSANGQPLESIEGKLTGKVEPSQENFKISLHASLALKYPSGSPLNLDAFLTVLDSQLERQQIDVKAIIRQENNPSKSGIVCLTVEQKSLFLPKDQLCFQDENTPKLKQTATLKMGALPAAAYNGKDTPCQDSHLEIQVNSEAHQSQEQVAEAQQDLPPYKTCREQQSSPLYPGGKFVPPTPECYAAVLDQTNLRALNLTVNYKVSQSVKKRWRRPLALLEGLLLPYAVDEDSAGDHASHENHVHPTGAPTETGEIELDLNIRKDAPILADIHYHTSSGKEQHFHGVDLDPIPGALKPQPVPSRFSPFTILGVRFGALGICSVTPKVVHTFDKVTLPADLPNCLTLVSADCGDKPQFAVLAKRKTDLTIAALVYLGPNKVELDGSAFKVNGQTVSLSDKISQELPAFSANSFKALKNGDEVYLTSVVGGVHVRYTGNFLTVTLDSRFRGTQSGLCGSWDSTPRNDISSGPDPSCSGAFASPNDRANSWVVRDGDCAGVGQACPA